MTENKDYYVRSRYKSYITPFVILLAIMAGLLLTPVVFRLGGYETTITAALYITSAIVLCGAAILGYLIFLAAVYKDRKPIEVSGGYVFFGGDRIHVSKIDSAEPLPNSGVAVSSGDKALKAFRLVNGPEIIDAINEQKTVFRKEA